jgi:uncharacterized protein
MASVTSDQAFTFACEGESLVGILHAPAPDSPPAHAALGVVVVVGGPQYRAGSHRQFVFLARALAAAGHPVLRFDVRGMGDASGAQRSFEDISTDVAAAVAALRERCPQVQQVALWGLCDGASAALLYLHQHPGAGIAGVCLLNPWVRSEQSLARTHIKHYYVQRLLAPEFWRKLLSGRIAGEALRSLFANVAAARRAAPGDHGGEPFQARMASALKDFDGSVLLVLSGDDYTAKEFLEFAHAHPSWRKLLERGTVQRRELPQADHTLSADADRDAMNAITLEWLATLAPTLAPTPTHSRRNARLDLPETHPTP